MKSHAIFFTFFSSFFSSLFKYFFSLFFLDLFYLGLGLVSNIDLKLTIFSPLLQYLVKFSRGDVSVSHYLWNGIGLLWANSIMALYFPCFTVWLLENFRVATVKRERTIPNLHKAAPTGRPAPLANAEIEAPPAITAEVIKPVSTIPMIAFNRFFFFASHLRTSISVNFFNQYVCGSCGAEGFKSG